MEYRCSVRAVTEKKQFELDYTLDYESMDEITDQIPILLKKDIENQYPIKYLTIELSLKQ